MKLSINEKLMKGVSQCIKKASPYKRHMLGVLALGIIIVGGRAMLIEKTHEDGVTAVEKSQQEVTQLVETSEVSNPLSVKPSLENHTAAGLLAYEIKVNQRPIGYFKTESEANQVLDQLVNPLVKEKIIEGNEVVKWYFKEEVTVSPCFVDVTDFKGYSQPDAMVAFIKKGTRETKTHQVQKGENYWVIAQYYGIDPSDLEAANPDLNPDAIQIGQKISLVVPQPLIDVCVVLRSAYKDAIPYDVTYESTDSLYKNETQVKVNGSEGEKSVVAEIVLENGKEINRKIIDEQLISQPVNQVVYQGTKFLPVKVASGNIQIPVSHGAVSSEFGTRNGRLHAGIDLRVPVGTAVHAADNGTVIYAGYSSSYGYYIKIDHGNGLTTVYAHNSQLVVEKGETVVKGQLISYSGNTGRSTGPHVHFEVRMNGTPINPRNYLNLPAEYVGF